MSERQCDKCGEMVSVTKAFCPACGHALVEEETRADTSEFQGLDGTMQLGQTMYNQMLSDMGLNIAKGAPPQEKRIEIIEPVAAAAPVSKQAPSAVPQPTGSNKIKWIIFGVVIILMFFLAIIVAAAVLFYFFWPRIS